MQRERSGVIRVVVGEDSPLMRQIIVETLSRDPDIEVVGTGSDGREILKTVVELKPDCVTLDLDMPVMNGLESLRYIMSEWPTPIVILSAHTASAARLALTCLEYGAIDFVSKTNKGMRFPTHELIDKVKAAASVDTAKVKFGPSDWPFSAKTKRNRSDQIESVILIGASTGGPQALMEIIPRLPEDLPACVVIAQHMPPNFTRYLAERLNERSALVVSEAEEGDLLLSERVLVTPGGMHIFLEEHLGQPAVMLLPRNDLQRSACPSIDFAMTSFAPVFKERLISIVLTGMGRDGTAGSIVVNRNGGTVACQDGETSIIFGMPGSVINNGTADIVLPLEAIADYIVEKANELKSRELIYERQ
jgi:two-component system chemotaxis response regulator CheB